MAKVDFINTKNLRIARENVGMTTFFSSTKFNNTGKDIVLSWESGDSLPTWKQAEKLAKMYGIPVLVLFSKNLIRKNKAIPDYRIKDQIEDGDRVKKLVNFVIKRQEWLEQRLKEEGLKNKLQGSGKNIETPKKLAHFIKDKLNINLNEIKSISGLGSRRKVLKYLIEKAENKGIFIGKTISYHKVEVNELRGLFIANDYCPFIILNRKDSLSAQLFSLIHEFAHFFRKTEAISNSLEFRKLNNNINNEEIFCNQVAIEFFLPNEELLKKYYNKEDISKLSEIYKLSTLAIFYRLKSLGKIMQSEVDKIEKEIKQESEDYIKSLQNKKKKKKGGNYLNNMKDSNGDLFNKVIAKYYFENKIGYTEASNLLNFSIEHLW